MSLLRSGYSTFSWFGAPFIAAYIHWRALKGYEEKDRLCERFGKTQFQRPKGPLLWINAVSVGEAIAGLTLIQTLQKKYPDIQFLLTTTTVSSAKVVEKRLPKNTRHQFCPVDTPQSVNRFLEYWQPDLAIWIESELWPNLIYQTQEKGIPTILLNGRISQKSFSNWKKLKSLISPLLSKLNICAVQSETQAAYFEELGADKIAIMGNIKIMMSPLTLDSEKYEILKKMVGKRPLWLAASTHPGEDEIILEVHKELKKKHPDILTILVPRHIERAAALKALGQQKSLSMGLRTEISSLEGVEVYIGDTLGEMGLFYAIASAVFMGATFVPKGGHNPIEAAQMGSFIIHGPHIFNNSQLYETLSLLGMSKQIVNKDQLAQAIYPFLAEKKKEHVEPETLKNYREQGLKKLLKLLDPHLKNLREDRT